MTSLITLSAYAGRVVVVILCVCVCVCVFICYHKVCYTSCLYVKNKVKVFIVAFTENASVKSSGIICQSLLLFSFPNELPMDNNGSFSIKLVCNL